MEQKMLSIGTIVLLKKSKKRILIIGYFPQEYNDSKVYDYSGVPFPEGLVDSRKILMFYHNQIEKVYHNSLWDDEVREFMNRIQKMKEMG